MCRQVIITACNTLREEFSRRISKSIIDFGDFLAAILIFLILKYESSTSAQISIWAWLIWREKTISAKKCFMKIRFVFNPF